MTKQAEETLKEFLGKINSYELLIAQYYTEDEVLEVIEKVDIKTNKGYTPVLLDFLKKYIKLGGSLKQN